MMGRELKKCVRLGFGLMWLLVSLKLFAAHQGGTNSLQGPKFTEEPPNLVEFSNSTGAQLHCKAVGNPSPVITWISSDGADVIDIPGLRQILDSGTLVLKPFRAEDYRQDVHAAVYKCFASNSFGSIISPDVKVKAAITQIYDVYVYDAYVIRGNTAVLKCHVPDFINDYVRIIAWLQDENFILDNHDFSEDQKYIVSPNGELYIRNTEISDGKSNYRCKTIHRLTNMTRISASAGKLFVTDPESNVPPRVADSKNELKVKEGETVMIPCVVQGYPIPKTEWFFKKQNGEIVRLEENYRRKQNKDVLILSEVEKSDDGDYICSSSNSVGKERVESRVSVNAPLQVIVRPSKSTVDASSFQTFHCEVSGYPVARITWLKDGKSISSGPDIKVNERVLTITNIKSSSRGVYQCLAKNDFEEVQGIAELHLGDAPPSFINVFEEQIINPGNPLFLSCSVSGSPPPNIIWFLDGSMKKATSEEIVNGHVISKINIFSTQVEDGGVYKCMAENKEGKIQHSARINIYGRLQARQKYQITAVAGETMVLTCPVYGYPIKTIKWEKDGVLLPVNLRQFTSINGTLTVENALKRQDNGKYICIASNTENDIVEASVEVSVSVPPKITPFSFQEDLVREGMRARIQCVISDGDPPLTLTWKKNGELITPDMGITIRDLDEYSSILSISSVTPKHNGNYTCFAKNSAAIVSHTARLSVNDDQFYKGMRAQIICAVSQGDLPIKFKWLKDGQQIPQSLGVMTRNIDGHANSLSIESVSSGHTGNYTCIASNEASTVSHMAQLLVYVAPKISPFSFQEESTYVGAFARLSCVVYQGDLPIHLTWLKDDNPLKEQQGIMVRVIDEYSSILTIESVQTEHSGTYTCVASNGAATVSHSATLTVNVPPRWIVEPFDQTVLKDKSVLLNCQADGYPKPIVRWMKGYGNNPSSQRKPLAYENGIEQFNNGSVYIRKVSTDHQGYYFCYASNGVGVDLSKAIQLQVRAPVYFSKISQKQTAKEGKEMTIECEAFGDIPITFTWFKTETPIEDFTKGKFQSKVVNSSDGESIISKLTVSNIEVSDGGIYKCLASNIHGEASMTVELIVTVSPVAPEIVTILNLGNRSVELTWKQTSNKNSPVQKFKLEYKRKQDSWQSRCITLWIDGRNSSTVVTGLHAATIYEFRIAAENEVGLGKYSSITTIVTGEEAPEGPPQQVEVESTDPQTIRISWKPPKKSLWNGAIRGYYIGYKIYESSDPFTFANLEVPEDYAEDLVYQISDLNMFTQYSIVLEAYNTGGRGPSSEEIVIMTSEDVPSQPPQNLRCSSLSSRSIYAIWEPPSVDSLNGILRGYKILYKPVTNWFDGALKSNNTQLPKLTLTGLEVDTNYSIQVLAYTKMGDGTKTEPVYCKTYEDVPGAPEVIKVLPSSPDSVMVAWKSPRKTNGIITKYNIYYRPLGEGEEYNKDPANNNGRNGVSLHSVTSDHKYFEVKGLFPRGRYAFWVTATSAIGEGPESEIIAESPAGKMVPAKSASFDDSIKTPWKRDVVMPCRAIGVPTPERQWLLKGRPVEANERVLIRFDGSLVIRRIGNEDSGTYTCKIVNQHGVDQVQYSVDVIVPPGSPIVDILSKSLNSVRLRWKPSSDGGSPITGYALYYKRDVGLWEKRELAQNIEYFTLENLACGSTYQLYLEALNSIGVGNPCEILTVTTKGEAFSMPLKEALIKEGTTFATINLDAWPSNGCPIAYFVAEFKLQTVKDWTLVSDNIKPVQRKLVIPGLLPASWYVLRITAHSSSDDFNIAEYVFSTLTLTGGTIPPDVLRKEEKIIMFYLDPWIFIPVVTIIIVIIVASVVVYITLKKQRKPRDLDPSLDWARTGTLARCRNEMGESVESFIHLQNMQKMGSNTLARKATLRRVQNAEGNPNPYSTIRLPCNEMTLVRTDALPHDASVVKAQNSGWIPVLPVPGGVSALNQAAWIAQQQNVIMNKGNEIYGNPVAEKMPSMQAQPVGNDNPQFNETTFINPEMNVDSMAKEFPKVEGPNGPFHSDVNNDTPIASDV